MNLHDRQCPHFRYVKCGHVPLFPYIEVCTIDIDPSLCGMPSAAAAMVQAGESGYLRGGGEAAPPAAYPERQGVADPLLQGHLQANVRTPPYPVEGFCTDT